jgi:esterase/lipase superfamily enzyme
MLIVRLIALILLAACSPRGEIVMMPAGMTAQNTRAIFVGSTRSEDVTAQNPETMGRSEELNFLRFEVSIPPDRTPGSIEMSLADEVPDPATDFLTTDTRKYPTAAPFRADLAKELRAQGGEAVIFVHGFNTTFAEGMYRMAQLGEDLALPGVLVDYAWPSLGQPLGYAYDRDSALFARDGLRKLMEELTRAGAKKIVLLGHSMGAQLVMETLRDLSMEDPAHVRARLSGVVLIAPDVDVSLFRAQAHQIGTLPQPFVIFASPRDSILRLSARISGEQDRLGTLADAKRVADLDVTLVDIGAFSGSDSHFLVGSSPSLIALLRNQSQVSTALASGEQGRTGLLPGVVLSVQNATSIILSPITN